MSKNLTLKGIPAAAGIAIGKAFLFHNEDFVVPRQEINEKDFAEEVAHFEDALIQTRSQIIEIQKKISEEMGSEHAEIFNAHLLVLEDRMLIEEVISKVKKDKVKVEYAFQEVLKKYVEVFSKLDDEYLRERLSDINDVGRRVLRNLLGKDRQSLDNLKEEVIIVAYDLSPSDTASMHKKNVIAFVTDIGGRTSHTAIVAKSLEIPAVVGLEEATLQIKDGDLLIVDGSTGTVIVDPDKETLQRYESERAKTKEVAVSFLALKDLPAETQDKHRVKVAANIELPDEVPSVISYGAEGIGLYRTEFFYMNRTDLPSEEEHFEAYKFVAQAMAPHPVVIRTLDLGGDKFLSQLHIPKDMHPFLGWRAIRFCLARPDIFKVQLRAILRASVFGKLKVMYPMISGVEELKRANTMLEEAKSELRSRSVEFDENIEVGVMIEVPSAALTCDLLARQADFFSIGTNDLIQYSLAVDRANEKVAYLYEPTHPAVLRLIENIVKTGHTHNLEVAMCGEMAGEPAFALLLLGLGLDEFSVPPMVVPEIKYIIRKINLDEAKRITQEALELSTGKEIEEFMKGKLKILTPEIAR
jgi:phosphotransferase system enzyme I (PtsI)